MTQFSRSVLSVVGLFVAVFASVTTASAATYRVNSFTINISDSIPASAKIRGAIATQRWSPMTTESAGKGEFDAFVVEERLATISSGFNEQNLSLNQYLQEYAALVAAFDSVATLANRPELRSVGFIFQGCSIHGARSMSQGFGNPDRTIAAISFCGRNYALFSLLPSFSTFMPELQYPHLQVTNGNDGDRVGWNDATTRQVRDEGRGLWTASLHPKLGHCDAAGDGIKYELLWLREVLKARVPSPVPDGAYTLKKLVDTNGWLGDYTPARSTSSGSVWGTGYKFNNATVFAASSVAANEVGQYIWFPTQVAAQEWKNYSDTGTCCLGLVADVDDGDPTPGGGDSDNGVGDGDNAGDGDSDQGTDDKDDNADDDGSVGDSDTPNNGDDAGGLGNNSGDEQGSTSRPTGTATGKGCSGAGTSLFAGLLGLFALRRRRR